MEKEKILETYSAQLQKFWNSTKQLFGFNMNLWAKEIGQGPTPCPGDRAPPYRARPLSPGPPSGLPVTIFCYMDSFDGKKIISHLLGRTSAATRQNLGETNLGLRQSCSVGDTSLQEGKSSPTSSSTILSSGGGQSPSTSSLAPSPLKTLVHLLYAILYQNHKLVPVGC